MSSFTILYFSTAVSYTNVASERLSAPLPLLQLFPLLESMYPGIKAVLSCSGVSIDLEYVEEEELGSWKDGLFELGDSVRVIEQDAEVAIIPPVSSG